MRTLLLISLMLVATASGADIFKCEPPDALFIEYQTAPCKDGERVETVTPADASPPHSHVLEHALRYYERHALGGTSFDVADWYTADVIESGLLPPADDLAARGKAYAEKHGGLDTIELEISGSTEGLVAVNVFAIFGDGKIDKQQTCWKLQGDVWRMHASCLEIALRADDVSDEDKEALRALEALFDP